ncbi:hypothetical protein GCM10027596_02690 [Nocardioides korecus]
MSPASPPVLAYRLAASAVPVVDREERRGSAIAMGSQPRPSSCSSNDEGGAQTALEALNER